jgi:ParB family chromosome partitioning protein
LVETVREGHFPTLDAAVTALHPSATRQKRARLRACASVVEELDGLLTTPEVMLERHILRLAAALRGGFNELIVQVLREVLGQSFATQWSALLPTISEAEKGEDDTPATATSPSRPRRMLHLKQGLTIRREETPQGYLLRFSGPEARRRGLMDDVMDQVERWFQPDG